MPDGTLVQRNQRTPQEAVISPLPANVFLHEVFDCWMTRQYPDIPFERDADDIICHGRSEEQARALQDGLAQRFAQWRLALHPHKTRIVSCKDANRRGSYPDQRFDFLGDTVRPRASKTRTGQLFVSFAPAVSEKAAKALRQSMRRWPLHQRNDLALEEIARWAQPILRGWVAYYGRFHASALRCALRTLDDVLVRWVQGNTNASARTRGEPGNGCGGSMPANLTCLPIGRWRQRLDDRSRMNREVHVRFWEGLAVRFRWATQLFWIDWRGKEG
jgi:hypothetical protein